MKITDNVLKRIAYHNVRIVKNLAETGTYSDSSFDGIEGITDLMNSAITAHYNNEHLDGYHADVLIKEADNPNELTIEDIDHYVASIF